MGGFICICLKSNMIRKVCLKLKLNSLKPTPDMVMCGVHILKKYKTGVRNHGQC